jgi:S1-C subfamily serine protease
MGENMHHSLSSRSILSPRSFFYGAIVFFVFVGWANALTPIAQAQTFLPQEALADLVKPSIVRIAEHVSGTAKIPEIKVDIRKRLVAVVPDAYAEVPVDEYLVGSGFIIHPDGYIATNAHVVSQETVKQMLASENALSALYENALFLSDAEMQEFLKSETDNSFSKKVLQYVIEHSLFELKSEVAVLRPDSLKRTMPDLLAEGFPAAVVTVNDNFLEDEKDVALLKIEETRLPALSLGSGETLTVGKKAYIFGFPATAELNQNNSLEATFTQGVVSAIKQSANRDFKLFQTDAKVSEGSSGGPLFDERGDVAGIITFQTDELSRGQGDNFAFALPIEMVKQAAQDADIPFAEGAYGRNFKAGFAGFSGKHCDKAAASFEAAKETNAFFGVEKYVEPYLKRCEELKQSGTSLDTRWDELRAGGAFGNPFFYLVGIGLILFGIFGGILFWILRQVHHEEEEIGMLEARLRMDEARIKGYDSMPRAAMPSDERRMAKKGKEKKII